MRLALAVLVVLVAAGVAVAIAQPTPILVAQPVAGPENDQFGTSAAMDADGGFAIAYEEQPAAGNSDVLVRRFNADLSPAGAPVNVNDSAARRWAPAVAMAPDGRFVVAYGRTTAGDDDILAQRFAANGTPVGAEIAVNPAGEAGQQHEVAVAMGPDGTFLVAWSNGGTDIAARAFAADGTPLTTATPIDSAGTSSQAAVAAAPDGRFIVAWKRSTTFGEIGQVMARRFDADGAADGADFPAFTGELNRNYGPPAIGLAGDGTFVLAFTGQHGALSGVLVQRQGGTVLKANDTIADTLFAGIAVEDDGSFTLAWEDHNAGTLGARTRRFGPGDVPDGPSQIAGGGGTANPVPSIAGDRHGRVVIAFTGHDTGGMNQTGAFLSRYDAAGVAPPPPTTGPAPPAAPPPLPPAPALVAPVRTARPAAAPLPPFASVVTLPSTRRCVSRRSFRIRLARRRGLTIVRADVAVDGRRVRVVRGARLTAPVDLRRLPRGRFRVDITVVTADGRTLKGTRRYRTCAARKRGGRRPEL